MCDDRGDARRSHQQNECAACRFGLGIRQALVPKQVRKGPSEVTTERANNLCRQMISHFFAYSHCAARKRINFFELRAGAKCYRKLPSTYFLERILESEVRPNDSASLRPRSWLALNRRKRTSFRVGFIQDASKLGRCSVAAASAGGVAGVSSTSQGIV